MRANKLENNILIGQQAWAASALAQYLPCKKFYYSECQRYGTFYINDTCYTNNKWQLPASYAIVMAHRTFNHHADSIIFVLNMPVQQKLLKFVDLLYATPAVPIKADEAFYIYKFKKGLEL